jgi:glucosyl-3-phosphoglycerate synthase
MPRCAERHRDDLSNDRLSLDPGLSLDPALSPDPAGGVSSVSPAAARWAKARSFHHSSYSPARIAAERAERGVSVSVCLPARECAETVGEVVGALAELRRAGAIDEIVVIDAASADGTAALAARAGAVVWQEAELIPSYGPVLGKGDAMWRALSVLGGELVCFLDADTESFSAHFATGLLGPLVCESDISLVKAFYRRPLVGAGVSETDGGGRVNHLTARPALELFYPQLAQVRQPLAGEVAARRELLERLPFATGYGVEIAMLIDAWREVGLEGIAQVDLDEHHNRHKPLTALTPMALTVLATIARRLEREGRLTGLHVGDATGDGSSPIGAPVERPALASLDEAARAGGSENWRGVLRWGHA